MKTLSRCAIIPASLCLLLCACQQESGPGGMQAVMAPEVGVVEIGPTRVTLTRELVGRTVSYLHAEVRPQVRGIIRTREFAEGGDVVRGQVLYQIEPESYQAARDSANAALTKAEANREATHLKARRVAELRKNNAISQQDNDDAHAAYAQAEAEVAACRAALEAADINLNRTRITAPISGRISKSSVTVGALVTADQPMPLATIYQIDPMYVDVTQTAEALVSFRRHVAERSRRAVAESEHPLRLILSDGSRYEHSGRLRFADVGVNEATGTVTVRAEFPNPDHVLLPGLYVRAELTEGENENALLVPQRSVLRDNRGAPLVLVVRPDGTAERRPITTGTNYHEGWLVLDGLVAGEKVIVDGIQKVRPGAPVRAVPFAEPDKAEGTGTDAGSGARAGS